MMKELHKKGKRLIYYAVKNLRMFFIISELYESLNDKWCDFANLIL